MSSLRTLHQRTNRPCDNVLLRRTLRCRSRPRNRPPRRPGHPRCPIRGPTPTPVVGLNSLSNPSVPRNSRNVTRHVVLPSPHTPCPPPKSCPERQLWEGRVSHVQEGSPGDLSAREWRVRGAGLRVARPIDQSTDQAIEGNTRRATDGATPSLRAPIRWSMCPSALVARAAPSRITTPTRLETPTRGAKETYVTSLTPSIQLQHNRGPRPAKRRTKGARYEKGRKLPMVRGKKGLATGGGHSV